MDKQIDQALHAAEQNMTDVLTLWQNGRTSDLVFGEALKDMKNDGLKLVKRLRADRAAVTVQTPEQRLEAFGEEMIPRKLYDDACRHVSLQCNRANKAEAELVALISTTPRCGGVGSLLEQVMQSLYSDDYHEPTDDFKRGVNHERKSNNRAVLEAATTLGFSIVPAPTCTACTTCTATGNTLATGEGEKGGELV